MMIQTEFSAPATINNWLWQWVDTESYSVFNTGLIRIYVGKQTYADGYLVRFDGVSGSTISIMPPFQTLEEAKRFALKHLQTNILPALITILEGLETK